jgi:predicted nucleic acid-binding protein
MNILVDSSILIDFFDPKEKSPKKSLFAGLFSSANKMYVCPAIYQEELQGIKDDRVFRDVKGILTNYPLVKIVLMDATNHAIDMYRDLRKKGITIRKPYDCLIAAYAVMGDMYLLHNDKDFDAIARLGALRLFPV